jgi:hypothetical protein
VRPSFRENSANVRGAYDALGVDGTVPKPFDILQLRALIRHIAGGAGAPTPPHSQRLNLSPEVLYNLLKSALVNPDEPEEPMDFR